MQINEDCREEIGKKLVENEEKKKGYMYIINNSILVGIMNLIVFISIYAFVFTNHIKYSSSMMYIIVILGALSAMLFGIEEKRKREQTLRKSYYWKESLLKY